ncbi:MAG: Wzz/FepE/Etk N-terminal domain-containing protein [Sediminibacterium sp.]|nr:Wzz/FepE/Etk N-terminal domain-containing protein [Sediminibacterium sp.]
MQSSFNLIEITAIVKSKWRLALSFTAVSAIIAACIVFIATPKYQSAATLLAGNSLLTDKASIFNPQIKDLYGSFGNGDDLDRIQAIAEMDTVLLKVIRDQQLVQYYALKNEPEPVLEKKALKLLRRELRFIKTPKDQLIISCLSKDGQQAARIVNAIVQSTEENLQSITQLENKRIIQQMDTAIANLKVQYSALEQQPVATNEAAKRMQETESFSILSQLEQYKRISAEYKIGMQAIPSYIRLLEPGTISPEPAWPNKPLVIAIAALAGMVFSTLLILLNNRSNVH